MILAIALLVPIGAARGQEKTRPFAVFGTVSHAPLTEISGAVKSRRFGNVYWVHNDSGNAPALFALTRDSKLIIPEGHRGRYVIGLSPRKGALWPGIRIHLAANIDWEDIAVDDDGLYLADMGNESNARRDLGVYVLAEPNPNAVAQTRALSFLPVRYPDQKHFPAHRWHFDCEAMFADGGKLYFLTKHRPRGRRLRAEAGTKLYRLDTRHTGETNVLTLVARNRTLLQPTGADLAPGGKLLAVITRDALWVFAEPENGDDWLSTRARKIEYPGRMQGTVQGVAWENDTSLVLATEFREFFRVPLDALKEAAAAPR